ncbi:MAG: ribosome assembly RNA-binding protein YhbY [Zetaproteobacteria bacterium]|nr:ribosome assembly RNA-binding protein YhbY [Pseudobdellovibrionaceae bacterium]|tara:strand:- start:98 stop:397 length:300 start_codon:yes stop_codon:yes gene_type:complete
MTLSSKQKKNLKGLAHNLKPVASSGQSGVSTPVIKEIKRGLEDHELIKVKVVYDDREDLNEKIEQILSRTKSQLIQNMGSIVTLFKASSNPEKTDKITP